MASNGCRSGSASNSLLRTGQARAANIATETVVEVRPPDGYTLLRAGYRRTQSTRSLYEKLNFNFIRDIAPVAGIAVDPAVHGGQSVSAGEDRSRVHRATPRPIRARSTWRRPASARRPHMSGELFKMMTGVNMVHVPYRGTAPVITDLYRRPGTGRHSAACPGRSDTSGLASCVRWRSTAATRSDGAAGHPDRGRIRSGLRGEPTCTVSARQRTRRPRSSTSSIRRSSRTCRSQYEGAACRLGWHADYRLRPPNSASSSPMKPRSGARSSSSRTSRRSEPNRIFHNFPLGE